MCFTVCVPVSLFRVCKSSWQTCELCTRVGFQRGAGNGACVLKKNSRSRRHYLAGCFWGKHFRDICAFYFCSLAWPAMASWYQPIRLSEPHVLFSFLFLLLFCLFCLFVCLLCFYKHFQHGAVLLFGLKDKFVFIEMIHLQRWKAAVMSESFDFNKNKLSLYAFCFMHHEWRMVLWGYRLRSS